MVRSLADRTFQLRSRAVERLLETALDDLCISRPAPAWPPSLRPGMLGRLCRPAFLPELKGSIGEGPNQTNYSDRSSVRILGIQRKPRKAPSRKKPLQRSGSRPKIQEGAARKERKGKQTALRERGVRRSRIGAKDAIHAVKRCYA